MDDQRGRATRTRWLPPRHELDPLALLVRARYRSRADLARASGLSHQTLRTYTDGVWRAHHPPSPYVLAMLGNAVDPHALDAAIHAAITTRHDPGLTLGQRAVLEALHGFPDQHLIDLAPHIHELARDHPTETEPPTEPPAADTPGGPQQPVAAAAPWDPTRKTRAPSPHPTTQAPGPENPGPTSPRHILRPAWVATTITVLRVATPAVALVLHPLARAALAVAVVIAAERRRKGAGAAPGRLAVVRLDPTLRQQERLGSRSCDRSISVKPDKPQRLSRRAWSGALALRAWCQIVLAPSSMRRR